MSYIEQLVKLQCTEIFWQNIRGAAGILVRVEVLFISQEGGYLWSPGEVYEYRN